jgi:hypothetical protein
MRYCFEGKYHNISFHRTIASLSSFSFSYNYQIYKKGERGVGLLIIIEIGLYGLREDNFFKRKR